MSDIVWEDPPTPPARRWQPFIAELKRHPGKWAIARTNLRASGGSPVQGLRDKGLQVRAVKVGYARWPEDIT